MRWSAEAKARLVEEFLKPGANVSAIARQAGLASSQLFGWRRKAIKSGAVRPQRDTGRLGFVEVTPTASASVEIELGGAVIRSSAPMPISVRSSWCGSSGRFARHDPGWREGVGRQSYRRF
ncbi:transposase [Mesorhizobium sp. M0913]|uniref:transposase n=1 Tax=Mesorhizobium sp. M0913 TaxID=2957026 RepID=UPI0033372581